MAETDDHGLLRKQLDLIPEVREAFAFLDRWGFRLVEASPTIVRYQRNDVMAIISHGRGSFELGFEAGREGEMYAMSEMIRLSNYDLGRTYRNFVATTADQVRAGTRALAELVEFYAAPLLRGEEEFLGLLKQGRATWMESYALDVLARQVKPQATKAFREGRYDDASHLFARILPRLSPAELAKYHIALERSHRRPAD